MPVRPCLVPLIVVLVAAAPHPAPAGLLGQADEAASPGGAAEGLAVPGGPDPATRDRARRRAAAALATVDALLAYDPWAGGVPGRILDGIRGTVLGSRDTPRFREWAGSDMKAATAWPLSQLLAAELDLALFTGDPTRARIVHAELGKHFAGGAYAPDPISRSGRSQVRYFDDNAWIGLDLVQAWEQTGDRAFLEGARALVPFLDTGRTPAGGILWREGDASPTLNTCSHAPAMQLFLALHGATGEGRFLARARELDQVLRTRLRRPDGLYRDHVPAGGGGAAEETLWSYNQGASLGAILELAAREEDPSAGARGVEEAALTGTAVLDRIAAEPDWLWRQPPAFNAVLFRNLLDLDGVRPDPRIRAALAGYLERAEREAKDPVHGAFERGGIGRYDGARATGITLIDQAAMAQMFALEGLSRHELAMVR